MMATSDGDERSPCDNDAVTVGSEKESNARKKVNASSKDEPDNDGAVVGGVPLERSDENDRGEGEDGKRSPQHVGPADHGNYSPSEPESGDDGEDTKQIQQGASTGQQEEPGSETFPMKLFRMLEEIEAEGSDDIVSFVSEGRAFSIHQRKKFVSDVMPRYFATSRISSLQRQLNLYGFRRLTDGSDKGAYFHESFQKGQKKMCQNIKRKKTHPGFETQTLRGLQPQPSSSEMLSLLQQQRGSIQRATPQLGGREAFPSNIPGQEHFQASSIFSADAGVINSRSMAVAALLRRQQELDILAASSRMVAEQPGLSTLLGSLRGSGSHHPIENVLSLSAHSESGRSLSAMEQALQNSHRMQLLNSLSQQTSWPKGSQDGSTGLTQCSPSDRVQSLQDAQSLLAARAQQLANASNFDMVLQAAQLGQTRPNQQVVGNNNIASGNILDLLRVNQSLMQTLSPHDLLQSVGTHVAPNPSNSASDIARALQLLGDIQKVRDGQIKSNNNNSQ